MSQNIEQGQQCFIPAHWQQTSIQHNKDQDLGYLNINRLLEQAKQLHSRSKPTSMIPRTCFLQLPIKKLPQYLQQPCTQPQLESPCPTPSFTPLQNPQHLSLSQYFHSYQIIYNKMKLYNRLTFQLCQPTSRFKPISHLFDFHHKLFKQLYTCNQGMKSPMHVMINDQFDSMFQCGNLAVVYKREEDIERVYYLLLENDVNSHGYTSWFFFKVKSCGKGKVCFHIVNLSKSPYLYRLGQKISIFSVGKYHENGSKWFKGGQNIQTYCPQLQKKAGGDSYSSIYFQYNFQQSQSEVYFSMSRPYTYSMLTKQLSALQQQQQNRQIQAESNKTQAQTHTQTQTQTQTQAQTQIQIIKSIYSIACNVIPIIVLSQNNNTGNDTQIKNQNQTNSQYYDIENVRVDKNKKIIVFMARQHPGEVVGSYFMQSLLRTFTSQDPHEDIKALLSKYTVIMVPMVNVDGVIHGNSRCNLAGLDLNRQWYKQCNKVVTPQTFYLRKLVWQLHQNIGIEYLIDLHGHSKKINSFFFCNKQSNNSYPSEYLPYLVSKINKRFDINSCTFNTTIDKKNTLRNQLYQFGMKNCITVENSYFGYWEEKCVRMFKDKDFQEMTESLLRALAFMMVEDGESKDGDGWMGKMGEFSREDIYNQVKICKQSYAKKASKIQSVSDIESESDPEADIMKPQQMLKIYQTEEPELKKQPQKKKNKIRKLKPKKQDPQKQPQIRASDPMRKQKQPTSKYQQKAHKSQKKLQVTITTKKSTTQQRFRQTPKPTIFHQKKPSVKKQQVIKQKIISMDENQSQTIVNKEIRDIKLRGKIYGAPFYKSNYDSYANKATLSRRIQSRLRTEDGQKNKIQREVSTNFGNYGKIKEERMKMFLNQTLSISKVENYGAAASQIIQGNLRKSSLKSQKYLQRPIRIHTDNHEQKVALQIDNLSNGVSIAKQKQQRKKFLSRNYKKELVRRKKILSTQDTGNKKYKRFQSFVQAQQKDQANNKVKPECNSVFYYFPML